MNIPDQNMTEVTTGMFLVPKIIRIRIFFGELYFLLQLKLNACYYINNGVCDKDNNDKD